MTTTKLVTGDSSSTRLFVPDKITRFAKLNWAVLPGTALCFFLPADSIVVVIFGANHKNKSQNLHVMIILPKL